MVRSTQEDGKFQLDFRNLECSKYAKNFDRAEWEKMWVHNERHIFYGGTRPSLWWNSRAAMRYMKAEETSDDKRPEAAEEENLLWLFAVGLG
jgi:hypothetical protein